MAKLLSLAVVGALAMPIGIAYAQTYNPPRYWYLITSRSTTSGGTQEQTYVLWPDAPPANGVLVKADGEGGTQNFAVQTLSGALSSKDEACAVSGIPLDARRGIGCVEDQPAVVVAPEPAAEPQGQTTPSGRHKLTWREFFQRLWKMGALVLGMLVAVAILGALSESASAVPVQPNNLSIMVGPSSSPPPTEMLGPTRDVGPSGPDAAGEELDMLIDDYLRAAGNTAIQYFDETDFRKVGTGMAEAMNQLDALEARARQGKLTNAEAQAGILNAYKQVGLDVVRTANLVSMLKALAGLGLAGIRAARSRLIGQTKTAIEAGLGAEKEIVDEIVKRGGKDLNNIAKLEADLAKKGVKVKIRVRGGNGKFPIVDAIDENGRYISVATSRQRTTTYLRGKYKIVFEGAGNKTTQDAARQALSKITGGQVTDLSFQANARLIVNRAHLEEMQAFVRDRVREFYISGEAQSVFANHLIDALTKQGFTRDEVISGVTSEFLKRVIAH